MSPEEKASVTRCAEAVTRHAELAGDANWQGSDVIVDVRQLQTGPLRERTADCRNKGRSCGTWLQHCSVQHDGWIINRRGEIIRLSEMAWTQAVSTLGEVLVWTPTETGVIRFTCITEEADVPAATRQILQRVRHALVYNFPGITYRTRGLSDFVPYDPELRKRHDWRLEAGDSLQHYRTAVLIQPLRSHGRANFQTSQRGRRRRSRKFGCVRTHR